MTYYKRLCLNTYATRGILVPENEIASSIKNFDKPNFVSIFKYNKLQYDQFKKTGSIAGVSDVVTDNLVFDLDDKDSISNAQRDALILISRLEKEGIKKQNIQVFFSGNKGFTILVLLDKHLTPSEFKKACIEKFGKGLSTIDLSIYDAARILRYPYTKHEVSGLYKIPLTYTQLANLSSEQIKSLATSLDKAPEQINADAEHFNPEWVKSEPEKIIKKTVSVSLADKPANWKSCKWNLLQGNFGEESGERHTALMVLAATCRSMGYDRDTTYYMCKSALKKQAEKTGRDEFPKEELWKNIIEESIFSDSWQGGAYSCKTDPWLSNYCKSLGEHACKDEKEEETFTSFDEMTKDFISYADNFEQNIIKTGIKTLDENLVLLSPGLHGLLGNPGSGKSSVVLQILKNASGLNIPSAFFSFDMGMPLVYSKLLSNKNGKNIKENTRLLKERDPQTLNLLEIIKPEVKEISFCFQSGIVVADIKKAIKSEEERRGQKIKLVVVDYLECIPGPWSDATANAGLVANQLKDAANELNICIILLLQTQKHSTPDISDPLLSMKNIKGASLIEQSCSTVISMWREGYNPDTVKDDRYMSIALVKNRFGGLWKEDFAWDGAKGLIREITEDQRYKLNELRDYKKEKRSQDNNNNGWS